MGRLSLIVAAAALAAIPGAPALAQSGVSTESADPAAKAPENGLPALIPVEAFASRSELTNAVVSPKGGSIAFTRKSDGKITLSIVDAATLKEKSRISVGETPLNWFRWAGEDRVLISVVQVVDNALNWGSLSRLMVFDMKSQELRYIGFRKQGAEGDDVLYTDPAGEYIVLSVSPNLITPPEVWRFPLDGSGEEGAVKIEDNQSKIEEWWADTSGVVRMGAGWTRSGTARIYYRPGPGEEFRQVTKLKDGADELENWDIIGIYPGSDIGYALTKGPSGRRALREMNYSTGELGKVVFEDPQYDIDEVLFDRDHRPVGYRVIADEMRTVWTDPAMTRHQSGLKKALPGSEVRIISRAEDGSRMLVLQQGHADPGAVYVYSPAEKRMDLFGNLRPEIDFSILSPGSAHTIRTRDGVEMRAYLTLPRGRDANGLPLIVMPHGGPYGVRDSLKYDDWVQLLANRGYAVLQPNFRGSGGYGEAFERLGDGEIGRKMQDDLDDATQWAIAQGYADPARVCVVGASYGGYAAMWAIIRNPERYRCAASLAGVTDWSDMLSYDRKYLDRTFYRRVWKKRVEGVAGDFESDAYSPRAQVESLSRPLLIAHGKEDERVPFRQYESMVKAARKAGKDVETLALEDGHSLEKEENEKLFLETLVAFLARHNPAD